MSIKISIGGVVVNEADATVSVLDRGFLYGDSVFEVMRTYEGVPFAERRHLERLAQSAERLLITLPVAVETLSREIRATLDAATHEGESYVRVVVTRGSGPLNYDPTTAKNPLRVIIVTPLPQRHQLPEDGGVAVVLIRSSRPTDHSRAAGAKASNYLANLLAVHEAKSRGAHEAILVGPQGEILEGASSNIFAVRDGVLRTPRLQSGILAGITRATVMEAATRGGIPLQEVELFPKDLYDADEVFLTSTLREVMPVVRVDDRVVGSGQTGPVTQGLLAAYRQATAATPPRI